MNNRIKKKLSKRGGYKRYANYRISQTPIKLIIHDGLLQQEINIPLSQFVPKSNYTNRNGRVYSKEAVMNAMKNFDTSKICREINI